LEATAAYEAVLQGGFATADFEDQPEPETLQCRDELDRTNWLGLVLKCQFAIQAGAGDLPIDPPIRCTSNRMYAVTYNDALARMLVLLGQVGAAQANWWRLKDEIGLAKSGEGLMGIDLTEGWP
jgi:hypothetical protein